MPRCPISVTLDADNVTWLRARAAVGGRRSVSALLDRIVSAARQSGTVGPSRSVVGTIDMDASDPLLIAADAAVRGAFERSLGRPLAVREPRPRRRGRARSRVRHG